MNTMTLTQIATRLRVLSQTLNRPITNLTMALKVAAPNQPTMHHQYRRNEREFNANSNYYYLITNKPSRVHLQPQQVNVNEPLVNHFLLHRAHYQI